MSSKRIAALLVVSSVFLLSPPLRAASGSYRILYSVRVYKTSGRSYFQLCEMDPRTRRKTDLTSAPRHHKQPKESPDGRYIAFLSGDPEEFSGPELWLFDRRTRQETHLWSGEQVALRGWDSKGKGLFLEMFPEAAGGPRICHFSISPKKFATLGDGENAAVSPKGLRVAFQANVKAREQSEVLLVDESGGKPERLAAGRVPAWSPDGRRLALFAPDGKRLLVVNVADGSQTMQAEAPSDTKRWNYPSSSSWSPNGKYLLTGSAAGTSTAHYEDYWLLDLDSREWRYVDGCVGANWSPDSSLIVCSAPRDLTPLTEEAKVWTSALRLTRVPEWTQQALPSGNFYSLYPAWIKVQPEVRKTPKAH